MEGVIIKGVKDKRICKAFQRYSMALLAVSVIYLIWACGQNLSRSSDIPGWRPACSFFEVSPVPAIFITILLLGATAYTLFMYNAVQNSEIVVVQDNVRGLTAFGKRVDLPMDSISAVGSSMFNSIIVSTSSCVIRFYAIENVDEVRRVIGNLIQERQQKQIIISTVSGIAQESPHSNADELKKLKELLDSGVITQEEFDMKKKQLLGL